MNISVIVPIYNVEQYLDECVNSILSQTHNDLEIILVNDGSTDNSRTICEQYVQKDNRVRLINQSNAGVSVARNNGLRASSSEYVTFVDSDDWLHPEMYEQLCRKIVEHPGIDVVMCDYEHVSTSSRTKISRNIRAGFFGREQIVHDFYPQLLVTEDFGAIPVLSACTLVIRKDILTKNNIWFDPKLRLGEDYLFTPQYMIQVQTFYYLKGYYLYYYRQTAGSRSKKFNPEWWSNFVYINERLTNVLQYEKFDFDRQIKLQLLHSALLAISRIVNDETQREPERIREVRKLMSSAELRKSMEGLEIRTRNSGLRLVVFLIKHKLALLCTYFLKYRK